MGNPSSRWKPQELTAAEKRNVEMGPGGWVRNPVAATGNLGSGADPEVIVAFRGTAKYTRLDFILPMGEFSI